MKINTLFEALLVSIFLISCAPASTSVPNCTPTNIPQATKKITLEPTLAPTQNLLTLKDFYPSLIGVDEHGAMACINYQGNFSDLDGVILKANFIQNDAIIDQDVNPQILNNKTCFEMFDAFYKPNISVTIELIATGTRISTKKSNYEIGLFDWKPFLVWIFASSPLNTNPNHMNVPNSRHFNAYDFAPINPKYKNGDHHPVFSPCTGYITNYEYVNSKFHNLELLCTETGFVIQLGHMVSTLDNGRFVTNTSISRSLVVSNGIAVKAGQEIGYLVWDSVVSYPHNHAKLMIPLSKSQLVSSACQGSGMEWGTTNPSPNKDILICSNVIDFFYPSLQGQGNNPTYGFWLEGYLPDQTKNDFFKGKIKPLYK